MISQSQSLCGWLWFLLPALRLATRSDRSFLETRCARAARYRVGALPQGRPYGRVRGDIEPGFSDGTDVRPDWQSVEAYP
jgi:hypothetical protein